MGKGTDVYLHKNGNKLSETLHNTYHSIGWVGSTGGRAVYQKLEAGDTLTLQTGTVTGGMWGIMFCVQFINN